MIDFNNAGYPAAISLNDTRFTICNMYNDIKCHHDAIYETLTYPHIFGERGFNEIVISHKYDVSSFNTIRDGRKPEYNYKVTIIKQK